MAHPERKQWRDFTSRLLRDHIDDLSHSGGIYHHGHKSLFFQTRIMRFMKNIDSFPIKRQFLFFLSKDYWVNIEIRDAAKELYQELHSLLESTAPTNSPASELKNCHP